MNVPTEDDWRSEPWGLDTAWAYENFHGKTKEEAVQLFEENALFYQEHLLYMPNRVFGYYLKTYITYLMSDVAKGDSDGASCFISLISFKAKYKCDDIMGLWPEIEPVLKKLADQQNDFDADWVIYGSFRSRIHEIVQRGFHVSFETATPEIVPTSVSIREMAGTCRLLPWPVAVQVFCNSGTSQIDATARKPDILRIFGPPDDAGGGDHPEYGYIPEWVNYKYRQYSIHFEFDGDSISTVMFMPPIRSTGTTPVEEKKVDPLVAWNFLFEPPPPNKGLEGDIGSK